MLNGYRPAHAYGPSRAVETSGGATSRASLWLTRKYLVVLGVVSALVAAAVVVIPAVVANADMTTYNLVVNSTAWGGEDANKGDEVCATATGVCTLRAAIEESNAIGGDPGQVTITVDSSIGTGTKMQGTLTNPSGTPIASDLMIQYAKLSNDDSGAFFNVTSPVTIDLGHQIQVDASSITMSGSPQTCRAANYYACALFYLNGPDIQVLNADQVMATGASFVIGPDADNVIIDGDTMNNGFGQIAATGGQSNFIIFREGVTNATVRNYQLTGYFDGNARNWSGLFVFDSISPNSKFAPMQNITIDTIQHLASTTTYSASTCSATTGLGCHPRIINFWSSTSNTVHSSDNGAEGGGYAANTINGLTFTNMLIQNMSSSDQFAFNFTEGSTNGSDSVAVSNLTIENNKFLNNKLTSNRGPAFITLPYANKLTGTQNSISNNVFTNAPSSVGSAIYYYGAQGTNSTTASNLTIANNYFNGYTGGATIYTRAAGLVTVTGNTFGPTTGSQGSTTAAPMNVAEEYTDSASVMYNTYHSPNYSTNQSIRTWAPVAATVMTVPDPTAIVMDDPNDGEMATCPAIVTVNEITDTNSNYPTQKADAPVLLQAYWTASTKAEVYLGQFAVASGTTAKLQVQLPVGTATLRDGTQTQTPVVNANNGNAEGYIRLQTHRSDGLAQTASSQYSRVVAVTGNCRPVLTINQASGNQVTGQNADMSDPTYVRDLHFTLTSSLPLDPSTVTSDVFTVSTTAVDETIDPSVLTSDHTSIQVTPVEGSNNTQFDVIVRVDDSAKVSVTVGADKVATDAGLTNQNAATYDDNSITYLNPLRVTPSSFTLVTGEPNGKQFTISIASGAPEPEEDLAFEATVDNPIVSLSTYGPIIRVGQMSADPVTVKAAGDVNVPANTETTITMTVQSADTNYAGLVVPTVTPYLFSTDPAITVTKQAYTGMTDTSSVQGIQDSGQEAFPGARLMDREPVCFVYTVTNTSADNWSTKLYNVEITDSDESLGENGLIATISELGIGEIKQVYACSSLQPVDTSVGE